MENTKMSEVVAEIQGASEGELRKIIEAHFSTVRTQAMKMGAQYMAVAVMSKIEKHLSKPGKVSLRDHERCIADIKKILAVQLTQQNDYETEVTSEGDEA